MFCGVMHSGSGVGTSYPSGAPVFTTSF